VSDTAQAVSDTACASAAAVHWAPVRHFDRATSRIPQPWRTILDWALTITFALAFALAFEAEVAKPYRIPSASMEPTLHCAKPGPDCLGSFNDRIIANRLAYDFGAPKRGQIVVFKTPQAAGICGAGDGGNTFVKRLIGLPGEQVSERDGSIFINGTRLREPYVDPALRSRDASVAAHSGRPLLLPRRRSCPLVRLEDVGHRAAQQSHRSGTHHLLAAEPVGLALVLASRDAYGATFGSNKDDWRARIRVLFLGSRTTTVTCFT
jgi:signal peptidase I